MGLPIWGAKAQPTPYPSKTVKLVIPYPPGGGTDITGRAMAQRLSELLGQSVVIENRPGATGMIGAAGVAKSAPDGYSVLFGAASEMAINVSLFKTMTYDPRNDFEPVSLVATFPLVFVAPASRPESLAQLIDAARTKPASVSYGSIGSGSPQHLAAELLSSMAKVKFLHVPYRGEAPAITGLLTGDFDFIAATTGPISERIRNGELRALAVTGPKRAAAAPEIPTVGEAGLPGYVVTGWFGLLAPAKTPSAIIERLNAEINRVLPSLRERHAELGTELVGGSPAEFRTFIASELDKWARVVKASGAKPE